MDMVAAITRAMTHDHAVHDHEGHQTMRDHDHAHDHGEKEIEGLHGHDHAPMAGPWWQSRKGRLTILSGAALVAAYTVGHLVPAIASYAFIVAMLVGLVPIARRAIMAALARHTVLDRDADDDRRRRRRHHRRRRRSGDRRVPVPRRRAAGRGRGGQGARQHPGADRAGAEDRAARRERRRRGRCRRKALRSAPSSWCAPAIASRPTASSSQARARSTRRR